MNRTHNTRTLRRLLLAAAVLLTLTALVPSCERRPPLYLHEGQHIEFNLPMVELNLTVYWRYDIGYDWELEWTYGWDDLDTDLFGEIGYHKPSMYELRRYYLHKTPGAPHTMVEDFTVVGNLFQAEYNYGYYDMLVWNKIQTTDGIQSLVFDEETTLDSVVAFTHMGMATARYQEPKYSRAFNQPEELFSAFVRDLYVSENVEDYDYFDPETNVYHKVIDMELQPVTYIYLTQVRLHNNRGRIEGVDGEANLSGMARSVSLNTGIADNDPVTVHYNIRFKKGLTTHEGQNVDIAGGRCLTFGIPNQNSSRVTRAEDVRDKTRHYIDVNFIFNNGMDSTMVFDVTDQVRRHYRGGVITVDLDVDTIKLPSRPGGSGFDAVVKDYDDEEYEFDM